MLPGELGPSRVLLSRAHKKKTRNAMSLAHLESCLAGAPRKKPTAESWSRQGEFGPSRILLGGHQKKKSLAAIENRVSLSHLESCLHRAQKSFARNKASLALLESRSDWVDQLESCRVFGRIKAAKLACIGSNLSFCKLAPVASPVGNWGWVWPFLLNPL